MKLRRRFIYLVLLAGLVTPVWSLAKSGPFKTVLPPGPFSTWPQSERAPAVRGAIFGCVFVTGMELTDFRGSQDLKKEVLLAMSIVCVVNKMPNDWPGQKLFRDQFIKHSAAAHAIDSKYVITPALKPYP